MCAQHYYNQPENLQETSKMPRRFSITSTFYKVPDFQGLSVRERVQLLETLLPIPTTIECAFQRAKTGLYAIKKMSCMLMEQLHDDCEFEEEESGKTSFQFWSEIAADTESRFQGNINSLILEKRFRQLKLAAPPPVEEDY
jgi:hypothetical protein